MPAEVACSASNPSAIWPVAANEVPAASPAAGAVTVVASPGAETVTGAVGAVSVAGVVLAGVLPRRGVSWPARWRRARRARPGPRSAWPNRSTAPVEPLADAACDGTAIIEMCVVPAPGAAGGQDLVTDVTAVTWPAAAPDRLDGGFVDQANAATAASAITTAPRRASRRIRTHRRIGRPTRATGSACRACSPGASGVPA